MEKEYKVNSWIQLKDSPEIYEATKAIFEELIHNGISFDKIVKIRGNLHSLKEAFSEYNRAYSEIFSGKSLPARVTYGKKLPQGEYIRLQCVTQMNHVPSLIKTDEAPAAVGPYSQAVLAGSTLFISGQIPIDPKTGALSGNTIHTQTKQALKNVMAILEAAHFTEDEVFEVVVFTTSAENATAALREIQSHYLNADIISEAADELPAGSLVELEATAKKL